MPLGGAKDEHSSCFHSSCQWGLRGQKFLLFFGQFQVKMTTVWCGGNRSDIRSPIATNPFFLLLFVSGLVMLTHDRTNKNLGLLKVNCSSIHLCFPPPSLHPAAVKDKINAIWPDFFHSFHFLYLLFGTSEINRCVDYLCIM